MSEKLALLSLVFDVAADHTICGLKIVTYISALFMICWIQRFYCVPTSFLMRFLMRSIIKSGVLSGRLDEFYGGLFFTINKDDC